MDSLGVLMLVNLIAGVWGLLFRYYYFWRMLSRFAIYFWILLWSSGDGRWLLNFLADGVLLSGSLLDGALSFTFSRWLGFLELSTFDGFCKLNDLYAGTTYALAGLKVLLYLNIWVSLVR
jgi:hypothetical protein